LVAPPQDIFKILCGYAFSRPLFNIWADALGDRTIYAKKDRTP